MSNQNEAKLSPAAQSLLFTFEPSPFDSARPHRYLHYQNGFGNDAKAIGELLAADLVAVNSPDEIELTDKGAKLLEDLES